EPDPVGSVIQVPDPLKQIFLIRIRYCRKSGFGPSLNEARKLNHQAVIEEDKRNKLPPNFQVRQERTKWQLEEIEAKK
uniref:Uncharacterized protein n=1 Tax=Romanomermis culicivorax TaxID=13658 RepID=A0A915HY12_ROMCU